MEGEGESHHGEVVEEGREEKGGSESRVRMRECIRV